jgi:hypothetical protein
MWVLMVFLAHTSVKTFGLQDHLPREISLQNILGDTRVFTTYKDLSPKLEGK